MKETTPPKDPKKKLWIGYAVIIAILFACNLFLFPAMMQAKVKSVNYSTFLQMLENKQLSTVQIEDQQIYFVDNENNSYKTNAIAQDNNLVTRLEDAGVEFGTVYQSPTIWDSLLNLAISLLPMILLFWWLNRYIGKKMQSMGGANSMLFGGGKSGAKQYVVDDKTGIKFNDVAGEDEAKESLAGNRGLSAQPAEVRRTSAPKLPKGVLLVGPPGTGKTLLAQRCGWRGRRALLLHLRLVSLWRCSWAWVPPRCATCSSRPTKRRPASCSSMRSIPSAKSVTGQRHGRKRRAGADPEPAADGDGRLRRPARAL